MSEKDLVAAKRDAEAAKARLLGTAHELQERLTAKNLAETAFDALRDRGQAAAEGRGAGGSITPGGGNGGGGRAACLDRLQADRGFGRTISEKRYGRR